MNIKDCARLITESCVNNDSRFIDISMPFFRKSTRLTSSAMAGPLRARLKRRALSGIG